MREPALSSRDDRYDRAARYDRVAIALHWLIALALLGQITFGFVLDDLAPRGAPGRAALINLHKSCGMVLGLLILVRLGWRLAHRPPAWPASMVAWQRAAAHWGHRALYAAMVIMPLSGYIASNFSKHGVRFFGVTQRPWGPDLPPVYAALNALHIGCAWVLCALIAGHVLAALKHRLIDRDTVLSRMSPFKESP
jgi:cytochrome b561